MVTAKVPLADRFWAKVSTREPGACWPWTGAKDHWGYGKIKTGEGRAQKVAHRVAYELLVGPIPDGLTLDHLCRNTSCVNPEHLEPVTSVENTMRGDCIPARNARKEFCKHGHPFDEANTYWERRGVNAKRHCRACRASTQIKLGYSQGKVRKRSGWTKLRKDGSK